MNKSTKKRNKRHQKNPDYKSGDKCSSKYAKKKAEQASGKFRPTSPFSFVESEHHATSLFHSNQKEI